MIYEKEKVGKVIYLGKGICRDYFLNFSGKKNSRTDSAKIFSSIDDVIKALAHPESKDIDSRYLKRGRKFSLIVDREISDEDLSYIIKEAEKERFKMVNFFRR